MDMIVSSRGEGQSARGGEPQTNSEVKEAVAICVDLVGLQTSEKPVGERGSRAFPEAPRVMAVLPVVNHCQVATLSLPAGVSEIDLKVNRWEADYAG